MLFKTNNYLLGLVLLLASNSAIAQSNQFDRDTLQEISNRLDNLQREVRQLRGQLELQGHSLEGLKQHQRALYLDLDQRIHQVEVQSIPEEASTPTIAAPTPPATPALPIAEQRSTSPLPASTPAAPAGGEKESYEQAFGLLREGNYSAALSAFRAFQRDYPRGEYADNAQYWIGEANYVTRDFDLASAAFQALLDKHPRSPKVPDALLKVAYIHYEQRQWDKSKEILRKLQRQYPNAGASRLAQQRLKRMKSEGK